MKVKQLIELLQKADPEMVVCTFDDDGAEEVSRVDVYEGEFMIDSEKLAGFYRTGKYVGIGWPGNYDATMYEKDCRMIQEL